jgi:hypothetical protein
LNRFTGRFQTSQLFGGNLRDFFGPAPGALKAHLSTVELSRITIAALTAGGGTLLFLQALLLNVGAIFPAPTDAALAAVVLTLLIEAVRRLGQGADDPRQSVPSLRYPGGNGDTIDRSHAR